MFPTAELHGGLANAFDYGPLGALLKKNVLDLWWRRFVTQEPAVRALDSAVLLPPKVWEHSGHLSHFSDPLVDCKQCKRRFRADHVAGFEAARAEASLAAAGCPCGSLARWGEQVSEVRQFNLMFKTQVGPLEGAGSAAYLRPETAQGAYVNFAHVREVGAARLPFGIAQAGKAFRNEVTPGQFTFRTREFEQMELQWFCRPEEGNRWLEHWLAEGQAWLRGTLGLRAESTRLAEHAKEDLAHYARRTVDIEFKYPFGWGELWGFADRGTHDLACHGLSYSDPATKEQLVPNVVEPALGLSRLVLALICDAMDEETLKDGDKRTVLRFAPAVAPFSVALLPLAPKNELQLATCSALFAQLAANPWGAPTVDTASTSIGKKYRRQDEAGTPFCATVDFLTAQDSCVTLRDRDSMRQVRIKIDDLATRTPAQLSRLFAE